MAERVLLTLRVGDVNGMYRRDSDGCWRSILDTPGFPDTIERLDDVDAVLAGYRLRLENAASRRSVGDSVEA